MGSKAWAVVVAGGLLVGAGVVTAIVSSPATAVARDETDSIDDRDASHRLRGFLGDVLDGLVTDGTITQEQADAVLEAAEDRVTELEEEHEVDRELLGRLLEDDVITEDEAEQLPDDHPLFSDPYDEAWEDGELSRDELRPFSRRDFFERGFHFGSLLDDGGIDQEEFDSLDDDHRLKQLDGVEDLLDDGLITPEELRELHKSHHSSDSGDDA